MGRRTQQVMSSGTVLLGTYLGVLGDAEFAVFGWVVAALGLVGVLVPVVLAHEPRRDR